jgi:hypothetical protein
MLLVLSTLPHFFTIQALTPFTTHSPWTAYAATVFMSTTASMEWHYNGESEDYRMYMDYSLASLWVLQELVLSLILHHRLFFFSSFLNLLTLVSNRYITTLDKPSYIMWHSAWHVFSAFKCYIIAALIRSAYKKKYPLENIKETFDSVL